MKNIKIKGNKISNIDEIFEADKEVRNYAKRMLNAKV